MLKQPYLCVAVCVIFRIGLAMYPDNKIIKERGKFRIYDDENFKISKNVKEKNTSAYGEYGVDWIYFPDGDGNIRIGFLRHPKYYRANFSRAFFTAPEPEEAVTFTYYNRKNENGIPFSLLNASTIIKELDNRKPLKFITHGWMSSGKSKTCQSIKDSYLIKDDLNVIIMDWSPIADTVWYILPLSKTKDVASHYAKIVEKIVSNGMDPKNIHFVGHSLGAHVSGFTGSSLNKTVNAKVGRITGLDPALPGFISPTERLSRYDAEFVDVIHTCGGFLGILTQIGHADFYPNGGTPPQPGCNGIDEIIRACSHGQSWVLFDQSINTLYEAYKCDSWDDFELGICIKEKIPFGDPAPPTARGSFYFYTKKTSKKAWKYK